MSHHKPTGMSHSKPTEMSHNKPTGMSHNSPLLEMTSQLLYIRSCIDEVLTSLSKTHNFLQINKQIQEQHGLNQYAKQVHQTITSSLQDNNTWPEQQFPFVAVQRPWSATNKAKELLINCGAEIKEAALSNDSYQTPVLKIDQLLAAMQTETTHRVAATENCVHAPTDHQTKLPIQNAREDSLFVVDKLAHGNTPANRNGDQSSNPLNDTYSRENQDMNFAPQSINAHETKLTVNNRMIPPTEISDRKLFGKLHRSPHLDSMQIKNFDSGFMDESANFDVHGFSPHFPKSVLEQSRQRNGSSWTKATALPGTVNARYQAEWISTGTHFDPPFVAVKEIIEDNVLIAKDSKHILSVPVNQEAQEMPCQTIKELFNTHSSVNNQSIPALKLVKTDNGWELNQGTMNCKIHKQKAVTLEHMIQKLRKKLWPKMKESNTKDCWKKRRKKDIMEPMDKTGKDILKTKLTPDRKQDQQMVNETSTEVTIRHSSRKRKIPKRIHEKWRPKKNYKIGNGNEMNETHIDQLLASTLIGRLHTHNEPTQLPCNMNEKKAKRNHFRSWPNVISTLPVITK